MKIRDLENGEKYSTFFSTDGQTSQFANKCSKAEGVIKKYKNVLDLF